MTFLSQVFPQNDFSLIALILRLPMGGAFVNAVWAKRLGKEAMTLTAIGVSFVASALSFMALSGLVDTGSPAHHEHVRLSWTAWGWMHTSGGGDGSVNVPIELKFSIDQLSAVMMLIITGVGFLI